MLATVYPPLDFPPTTLSITLSKLQVTAGRPFEGDVSIRNLGPNDAVLNLGITLGNGQSYPDRLSLVARDPKGQVYTFIFAGPGGVAGRIDPMVVSLARRRVYTVHGRWGALRELPPEKYKFHVEFEGVPARAVVSGMRDVNLNLLRYWLGKVSSNENTLSVP